MGTVYHPAAAVDDYDGGAFWIVSVVSVLAAVDALDMMPSFHAGLNIYPMDIGAVLVGSLAIARSFALPRLSALKRLLVLIFLLSLVEFVRGTFLFGTTGGVAYRQDAFMFVLMLYLAFCPKVIDAGELFRLLMIPAVAYLVVFLLHKTGLVTSEGRTSFLSTDRGVPADGALAFAVIAMAGFCMKESLAARFGRRRLTIMLLFFLTLVVLTYHRSVWICMPAGFLTYVLCVALSKPAARGTALPILILVAGLYLIAMLQIFGIVRIDNAIDEIFKQQSTANWRILGWADLLEKMSGTDFIWGKGYGADLTRYIFGEKIKNSPHNYYIGRLWFGGAIYLLLTIFFYFTAFRDLIKRYRGARTRDEMETGLAFIILLAMFLTFFMSYSLWVPIAVVVGLVVRYCDASGESDVNMSPS